MSWSASATEVAKDAIELIEPSLAEDVREEQEAQYAAAIEAARVLAAAAGRAGDRVTINVSGHANPDHAPRAGWANEFVTVTVAAIPTGGES